MQSFMEDVGQMALEEEEEEEEEEDEADEPPPPPINMSRREDLF